MQPNALTFCLSLIRSQICLEIELFVFNIVLNIFVEIVVSRMVYLFCSVNVLLLIMRITQHLQRQT
jgi:hypothetical protein